MKINLLIYIIIATSFVALPWQSAVAAPVLRESLIVQTQQGQVTFHIEVAKTSEEKEKGLMHRASLPADYGMLFLWPVESQVRMWMKNTLIPLDMLFIDKHGRIIYIARDTTPQSTAMIGPSTPVKAVLEIGGGMANKHHIAVGDIATYEAFEP